MTEHETVTLKEHFDQRIDQLIAANAQEHQQVNASLAELRADVGTLAKMLSGVVTWKGLAAALTILCLVAGVALQALGVVQ